MHWFYYKSKIGFATLRPHALALKQYSTCKHMNTKYLLLNNEHLVSWRKDNVGMILNGIQHSQSHQAIPKLVQLCLTLQQHIVERHCLNQLNLILSCQKRKRLRETTILWSNAPLQLLSLRCRPCQKISRRNRNLNYRDILSLAPATPGTSLTYTMMLDTAVPLR